MDVKNIPRICILQWLLVVVTNAAEPALNSKLYRIPLGGYVIIDTDAGIDDAAAILMCLGYSKIRVEAITCVRGNTDVVNVAINVQKTLNVAKRPDIPIHIGSDFGLVHMQDKGHMYGEDGFGDIDDNSRLQMVNLGKGHASVAMSKLVSDRPGEIVILCLGPLTNIALACHIQPQFLKLARRVIILGGSLVGLGGLVPGVEFNFQMDPEAAALVLNRALDLRCHVIVMPAEVLKTDPIPKKWRWDVLAKLNSPAVTFLNRLQEKVDKLEDKFPHRPQSLFNAQDVYLPVVLMREEFIQRVIGYYVSVDTHGRNAKGSLIADHYNVTRNPANVIIISRVNAELVQECMMAYLS